MMGEIFTFVLFGLSLRGIHGLCENNNPKSEKAYNGPYEIDFPTSDYSGHTQAIDPRQCSWLIEAYRDEFVVSLQFRDVTLATYESDGSCEQRIDVYDGPQVNYKKIASFCGHKSVEIVTTSKQTLIEFISSSGELGGGKFKLFYKAVRERSGEDGKVIKMVIGYVVGGLVVCIGILVLYKRLKSRSKERRRINSTTQNGGRPAAGATGGNHHATSGRGEDQQEAPRSFLGRVTLFFQKLNPRRPLEESSVSDSSDIHTTRVGLQQNRRGNRYTHSTLSMTSGTDLTLNPRASLNGLVDSDTSTTTPQPDFSTDSTGHENFGYQAIPVSSFTADPTAVRPPAYEECVSGVNPLYLHHRQQNEFAHYNRRLDDQGESHGVCSPPPPYTEIARTPVHEASNDNGEERGLDNASQAPNVTSYPINSCPPYQRIQTVSLSNNNVDQSQAFVSTSAVAMTPVAIPDTGTDRNYVIRITTPKHVARQTNNTSSANTNSVNPTNVNSIDQTIQDVQTDTSVAESEEEQGDRASFDDNQSSLSSEQTSQSTALAQTAPPLEMLKRAGLVNSNSHRKDVTLKDAVALSDEETADKSSDPLRLFEKDKSFVDADKELTVQKEKELELQDFDDDIEMLEKSKQSELKDIGLDGIESKIEHGDERGCEDNTSEENGANRQQLVLDSENSVRLGDTDA